MILQHGILFDRRYRLDYSLGQGASAQVWLAYDTMANDLKVAIKILSAIKDIDTYGIQNFQREFTYVYKIQHQNLLTPTNYAICDGTPYLVLPYCENGSATSMLGRTDEDDVIRFLHDVSAALECLHAHHIIHQDIKPDNILLDDDCNFLVTDFGISAQSTGTPSPTSGGYGGTRAYMGPERFEKDAAPINMNDMWALGATAYELATGNAPFGDNGGMVQAMGESIPELPDTLNPEVRKIILSCLDAEPWNRPRAEEIRRKTQLYLETGSWQPKNAKKILYWIGAGAATLLLLIGLFVWDYNRTKVFYYKDYVEYWGIPKGIGRLSGSEMKHRSMSYRFECKQRKLRKLSLVNSAGKIISHSETEYAISRYSDMDLFYTDNGKIDYKIVYDANGKVLYKMDYDENLKTVTFRQNDEYGTEKNLKANTTNLFNTSAGWFEDKSRITRFLLTYDDKGLLTEQRYAGLQNLPVTDAENVHGMRFTYDKKGHKTEEQFIGLDGNITANGFGLAVKQYEYDDDDNWVSVTYLNAERKASHDGNNCAHVELDYDKYGNRISEKYYTLDKKPSIRTDVNVFGFAYQYDKHGFQTELTSLDMEGQPMANINGVTTVRDSFNTDGFIVKRIFLDADNNPTVYTEEGESYGMITLSVNDHGQPLTMCKFDEYGNPIENAAGVHQTVNQYDSLGNTISTKFFSNRQEPVGYDGFHHEVRIGYDDLGNMNRVAYYDEKGKPTVNSDGVACFAIDFNRQGGVTKFSCLGTKGEPVLSEDLTAGYTCEYDDRGNLGAQQYFDIAGKTCMSSYGYATKRYSYDEKTNLCTQERWYDATGKLLSEHHSEYDLRGNIVRSYVLNANGGMKPGTAIVCYKYDINNHCTEMSYQDLKGNKVNKPGGSYSVEKSIYDERGNATETTYWGTTGKPAQDEQKTHKRIHKYDDMNRIVYEKNLNASGQPLTGTNANPEGKCVYDQFGNRSEVYCYDGFGKPRLSADGFFAMKSTYNKRNQLVTEEYFDTENKLAVSKSNGYAKALYTYDGKGNRTEEKYCDAQGKCFRIELNTYSNKNKLVEYTINDGNKKPTDKFTQFAKMVVSYDKTGVIPVVRKYYTASGKLMATQQYNAKTREWQGAKIIVDWRDNVVQANRECPIYIEDGLLIQKVSYSGSIVYVTFKMTKLSADDLDADKLTMVRQYIANLKTLIRQSLKIPTAVNLEAILTDRSNNTL